MKVICIAALVVSSVVGYYNEPLCMHQISNNDWHPIRIVYQVHGSENVSADQVSFVRTALDTAIAYWSKTVSVRRSAFGLYYERPCGASVGNLCIRPGLVNVSDYSDSRRFENDVLFAMFGQSINNYKCGDVKGLHVDPWDIDGLDIYKCGKGGGLSATSSGGQTALIFNSDDGGAGCKLERSIRSLPGGGKLFDMDLLLHIDLGEQSNDDNALASASKCGEDECGRPTIGGIKIERRFFKQDQLDKAHLTLVHEIAHILGFSTRLLQKWIDPLNGQYLVHPIDRGIILAWVQSDRIDGLVKSITFGNSLYKTEGVFYDINVPHHAIGLMYHPDRDVDLSECRCPTTVFDRFTESDLIHCMNFSAKTCLFGIKSGYVVKTSREYYACGGISGMELEYSSPGNAWLFNPHWKLRNLTFELMNANTLTSDDIVFVSPMTLALLKDSGWYLVNEQYGQTSLIRGMHLGYKEGCDLLERPIASLLDTEEQISGGATGRKRLLLLPHANKEFNGRVISQRSHDSSNMVDPLWICSSSALSMFKVVEYETPHEFREETMRDYFSHFFCPLKSNDFKYRCVESYWVGSDGTKNTLPKCKPIICHESLMSYSIDWGEGEIVVCDEKQETITIGGFDHIVCVNPQVICAQLYYPHYGDESGINRVPGLAVKLTEAADEGAVDVAAIELEYIELSDKGSTTAMISTTENDNSKSG